MVGPPRGSGMAPPEYVMSAIERVQPLPEIEAVLDAEMLVSDVAGWCADAGGEAGWDELIRAAAARRSRRSGALLRGLAAVLPEPHAERAAAVVRDWPDAYRPAWADAIGALQVADCWYGTSEEQTAYAFLLASYTYDGAEPHAVAVSIDNANGGAAKDVFVTAGPGIEITRERLAGFSAEFGPVDAATAHRHLSDAYTAADEADGADQADGADNDTRSLRVLCMRRVREFGDG